MRELKDLRASQRRIIDGVMSNECYMIACDMGIGKTGASLTAIRMLLDSFQSRHVLVVAPLLVAEETWPAEIEAWKHTSVLEYEVLTGSAERREQRARRLTEVTIVNRENLSWLVDFWGDDWPYDTVFMDEMSSFKNPSKRNKPTKKVIEDATAQIVQQLPRDATDEEIEQAVAKGLKRVKGQPTRFGKLCSTRKRIDRLYGLTGTPTPNGLLDIWSQYYLLDQGERLHSSFSKYRTRWFDGDYNGYKYTLRPGAFEQITEAVQDITVSMRTEDFVDMPPIVYNTIKVTLPPKVLAQYKKFEREAILAEHDIEAVNAGVLTGKLLQLANGSIYDAEGNVIEIHELKLDALEHVIEEAAGAPVLVAYSYQFDLEKLKKRFPHAEVVGEASNVVKRWNEGRIRLLLAHPQSAGHGLNLQYGGCITVWYGLCWSLEYYQQLNKRLHRPGQTNTVFIHHIVAEDTMDERVMRVLPEKDAVQDAFIEATLWKPVEQLI